MIGPVGCNRPRSGAARIAPSTAVAAGDPAGDPDIYPGCRWLRSLLLITIRMVVTIW